MPEVTFLNDQTNSTCRTCHAFRSAEGLRWSSYLDECIDYVAQNSTEAQDHVLIAQVKLQLMVNELRHTYRGRTTIEIPVGYLDALRLQLDNILHPGGGASPAFGDNCMLAFDLDENLG